MVTTAIIEPYLFFAGRCEEALEFYRKALNAQIDMVMHYQDNPEPPPPGTLQPGFEKKVMHASFRIGGIRLMAADDCTNRSSFNGFRLSLALPTDEVAQRAFQALSDGGQVQMPLSRTFWSPCFGMLTDRFGVGWMVTVSS